MLSAGCCIRSSQLVYLELARLLVHGRYGILCGITDCSYTKNQIPLSDTSCFPGLLLYPPSPPGPMDGFTFA